MNWIFLKLQTVDRLTSFYYWDSYGLSWPHSLKALDTYVSIKALDT